MTYTTDTTNSLMHELCEHWQSGIYCRIEEARNLLKQEYNVDMHHTFSQFSRTYGFAIYYTANGETVKYNGCFEKHASESLAMNRAIEVVYALVKNGTITAVKSSN